MAYKTTSFLALVLISNVLLATTWHAVARPNVSKNCRTGDKKEPQWFFKNPGHGGVHIPGIGGLPPNHGLTPPNPFPGGSGGAGSGPTGRSYVPGGDDTFVPNPGFEVPNPGSGGRVPATASP